jgi:futalosine hydrolase
MEMGTFLDRHPARSTGCVSGKPDLLSGPDRSWDLVISGPGVFNAAVALAVCLEKFRPAFILHTGIAGVFDGTGLNPGDAAVALADTYVHTGVDTGFPGSGDPGETGPGSNRPDPGGSASRSGQTPLMGPIHPPLRLAPLPFDLIPGHELSRQGIYDLDSNLADDCFRVLDRHLGCRVVQGPFITVSAVTGSLEKAHALSDAFSPVMESMEGAAAAHVAALYQVPMVEVRAASNRVGDRDKTRWDIPAAVQTVADICDTLLAKVSGHGI